MTYARTFQSTVVQNAAPVTTTETVIGSVVVPTNGGNGVPVRLKAFIQYTTGTGTTSVQLRIRKGIDATGTLVGALGTVQIGASLPIDLAHAATDFPAEIANQTYVVTVQQVAATGNASVQGVDFSATIGD